MEYFLLETPISVNWNYTYKCNFNCIHCYSRTRTDIDELTTEEKLRVAENLVHSKVINVNLGGGEPLLCEDCFEIIEYMSSRNISVNLSTNGWKINNFTINKLKKAGLRGVYISIDHVLAEIHDEGRNCKGSFNEACEAVRKYVAAGLRVFLSTTITSRNYDVIEDIIALGISLGANGVDLKRLKTMGNAYERCDLEITEQQKEELYKNIPMWKEKYPLKINLVYGSKRIKGVDVGCPCGKTSIAIMCNGDISPCVYNTYKIGNAINDDINDVWCNSSSLKFLRENFNCLGLGRGINTMYQLKNDVVFIKDHRISEGVSVLRFAMETTDYINPADPIAVVAVDGIPYELNLTAAIILDEIIAGKKSNEITDVLSVLFSISKEKAISAFQIYIDKLVDMHVLKRV